MSTPTFERIIQWMPAFDKRHSDPKRNYGIHGLEIRFILKGQKGAIQFVLYTNWHLPHVTKELKARQYEAIDGDPHWMERPTPADFGYHAYTPQYEGQTRMGACAVLPDAPRGCYYDGSSLRAEPVYHRLLAGGDAGVWAALEEEYKRRFEQTAEAVEPVSVEAAEVTAPEDAREEER